MIVDIICFLISCVHNVALCTSVIISHFYPRVGSVCLSVGASVHFILSFVGRLSISVLDCRHGIPCVRLSVIGK